MHGVYFTFQVQSVNFVDFCGKYQCSLSVLLCVFLMTLAIVVLASYVAWVRGYSSSSDHLHTGHICFGNSQVNQLNSWSYSLLRVTRTKEIIDHLYSGIHSYVYKQMCCELGVTLDIHLSATYHFCHERLIGNWTWDTRIEGKQLSYNSVVTPTVSAWSSLIYKYYYLYSII